MIRGNDFALRPVAAPATSRTASPRGGAARVVGMAGGVGTTTVAAALGGVDLGRVAVQPAEVVVCRLAVDSLARAARVAALMVGCGPRRILTVTSMDPT